MKPVSLLSAVAFAFSLTFSAVAGEIPEQLPRTTGGEPAEGKPVQVYILSGQSNMVGMGTIDGGGQRWGDEMIDPVLSVYPGPYDPNADYDEMDPIATQELEKFGGVKPTPFPGGGVQIVRGKVKMEESGLYRFKPGYRGSTVNIMEVDGKEVHRREPGGDRIYTPIQLEAGEAVPFKITYLTNQANGLGWTSRVDVPGTMTTLAKYGDKFPHLLDEDGNWLAREDVFYKGVVTSRGHGPMQIGVSGNTFGPEIGFGWVMGHLHDAPVLILKTSQGNRSLGWDFLPPGSKRYEHTDEEGTTWVHAGYKDSPARWEKGSEPEPINWYAGKQYDECFDAAKKVLKNFDEEFPQWKGRGYEIAGFGWWQGHKDGGERGTGEAGIHAQRYEHNLVNLINTLRKEFEAPKAPFIVATVGFSGGEGWEPGSSADTIFKAQMAVGDPSEHPEYAGNVASVDTRPFWRSAEASPKAQGFHYNRNAETYYLVGEAMGRAMAALKVGQE